MGRDVRVQRSTSGSLNLAEIEVKTCPQNLAALPVRLLSFTAEQRGNSNQLTWITSAEEENTGFFVEHSADGSRFSELGWVAGAGNAASEQVYSFTDQLPLNGSNYYRLRQVDFDGSVTFSQVIRLDNRAAETSWTVYPNPVSGGQELVVQHNGNFADFSLYDLAGREVFRVRKITSEGRLTFTTAGVPTGIYLLRNAADGSARRVVILGE